MKRYNIFRRVLILALASIVGVACQGDLVDLDELRDNNYKNKKSTAAPTITEFYSHSDYADNETPTPLSQVNTGEWIVVEGENLEGVTSVVYNNEELDLSEAYAQWDMMLVAIPENLPDEITYKFKYTTSLGTTETDLGLVLPAAQFNSVENEFELQGNTTKILGKNFSIYGFGSDDSARSTVVLYNNSTGYSETLNIEWSDDTNLKVTIPDNAPDNSLFKFILDGEEDAQKLHYRPTDLLLFKDTELVNNNKDNSGITVTYTDGKAPGDPANLIPNGLDGESSPIKYFRIVGNAPSGWYSYIDIWNTPLNFTMDGDKSAEDYYFVFELNTSSNSTIPIGSNVYKGLFKNGTAFSLWADGGASAKETNGEWITYRVKLSTVSGMIITDPTNATNSFSIKSNVAMTNMDHSFANFRVQPILPE